MSNFLLTDESNEDEKLKIQQKIKEVIIRQKEKRESENPSKTSRLKLKNDQPESEELHKHIDVKEFQKLLVNSITNNCKDLKKFTKFHTNTQTSNEKREDKSQNESHSSKSSSRMKIKRKKKECNVKEKTSAISSEQSDSSILDDIVDYSTALSGSSGSNRPEANESERGDPISLGSSSPSLNNSEDGDPTASRTSSIAQTEMLKQLCKNILQRNGSSINNLYDAEEEQLSKNKTGYSSETSELNNKLHSNNELSSEELLIRNMKNTLTEAKCYEVPTNLNKTGSQENLMNLEQEETNCNSTKQNMSKEMSQQLCENILCGNRTRVKNSNDLEEEQVNINKAGYSSEINDGLISNNSNDESSLEELLSTSKKNSITIAKCDEVPTNVREIESQETLVTLEQKETNYNGTKQNMSMANESTIPISEQNTEIHNQSNQVIPVGSQTDQNCFEIDNSFEISQNYNLKIQSNMKKEKKTDKNFKNASESNETTREENIDERSSNVSNGDDPILNDCIQQSNKSDDELIRRMISKDETDEAKKVVAVLVASREEIGDSDEVEDTVDEGYNLSLLARIIHLKEQVQDLRWQLDEAKLHNEQEAREIAYLSSIIQDHEEKSGLELERKAMDHEELEAQAVDYCTRLRAVDALCSAELGRIEESMRALAPLNAAASAWGHHDLKSCCMTQDYFLEVITSMNLSSIDQKTSLGPTLSTDNNKQLVEEQPEAGE